MNPKFPILMPYYIIIYYRYIVTCGSTTGIEGKNSLNGNIHGRSIESFEHNLSHFLTISLRIEGCFGEENRVFFGGNTEFIIKGMMPYLFHIIPIAYNSVLNWIL